MHLIAFVYLYFLGRIRDYFIEWINSRGLIINSLNGSDPGADSGDDSSSSDLGPARVIDALLIALFNLTTTTLGMKLIVISSK